MVWSTENPSLYTWIQEDIEWEREHPGVKVVRLPLPVGEKLFAASSPPIHSTMCSVHVGNDWPMYDEDLCSCKYDERRQQYDLNYRYPGAKDLPIAKLLSHK